MSQYSIAILAILTSFPLLPHFGIILPPSTPILMAIALQTSCIYRASSMDLRKSGNAVFYHSQHCDNLERTYKNV